MVTAQGKIDLENGRKPYFSCGQLWLGLHNLIYVCVCKEKKRELCAHVLGFIFLFSAIISTDILKCLSPCHFQSTFIYFIIINDPEQLLETNIVFWQSVWDSYFAQYNKTSGLAMNNDIKIIIIMLSLSMFIRGSLGKQFVLSNKILIWYFSFLPQ